MSAKAIFIFLLLVPLMVHSKGKTTRIEISGPGLDRILIIQAPEIVDKFHIWGGPGTHMKVRGVPMPPVHLDPDKSEGRFIDWPRGIAEQPSESPKYEVSFYCESADEADRFCYGTIYTMDETSGYIYLPTYIGTLSVAFARSAAKETLMSGTREATA